MAHRNLRLGRWILGVAAVAVVVVGVWSYLRMMKFETLTTAGRVNAASGFQSLTERDPVAADGALRVARQQFSDARNLLGPGWLHQVPWLGRQLTAADDLSSIVIEASSAGIEFARLMRLTASAPQEGRLSTLLRLVPAHLDPALVSLTRVAGLSDDLTPDGLLPPLANAVAAAKRPLVQAQPLLGRSHDLLELERYLFSRQHRFLVVTQDSSNLRATGGSMETYGLVTFGPQGFALTTSADVASLPKDTLNLSSPPGRRARDGQLSFSDANWWMDFPTSATKMAQFWKNLGQPEIDGIVALDVPMIQDLLNIYGPLVIPEAKTPLTASNLLDQLTDVVPSKGVTIAQQRKKAVISLTTALVNRVTDLSTDQLLPTIEAFIKAADQKHLQIYLLDPTAQTDMVAVGWAGALDPPDGTTDLVGVSNSDVEPSKANLGVTKSLDYTVVLKPDGGAGSTLTLGYKKSGRKLPGIPDAQWANYLRAHRLAGTQLAAASKGAFTSLDDPTGVPTFGHYFQLRRGSRNVVLQTTMPQVLRPVSTGDGEGRLWQYRLLVAKQADLVDTRAKVSLTVPTGWRVTDAEASFRVTGERVATTTGTTTVTLATPLSEDLLVDVTVAPDKAPR